MKHAGCSPRTVRASGLLRLLMLRLLAGCASPPPPTPPVAGLAAAATCHDEVAQAVVASGQFDLDEEHAYTACMRRSGWEL
jgi:hypothetical protein